MMYHKPPKVQMSFSKCSAHVSVGNRQNDNLSNGFFRTSKKSFKDESGAIQVSSSSFFISTYLFTTLIEIVRLLYMTKMCNARNSLANQ